MKLGKLPARHDPRTLHFSSYVNGGKLPPAPSAYRASRRSVWPMFGNNVENCCTCAAAGHMIMHWSAANHVRVKVPEAAVIAAFLKLAGPGGGQGATMLDALRFWRREGLSDHRIHSFVKLKTRCEDEMRTAIYLFGSAYIGLELPDFARAATTRALLGIEWSLPRNRAAAAPNPANGHCVAAVGYDDEHVYVVTWGTLKRMGWSFFRAYNEESYGVLSYEWFGDQQRSPSGFDLSALERDLRLLRMPQAS